jgi:hypothetical protein
MGLLYGRAGRLTAENGRFRPGQAAAAAVQSAGEAAQPYLTDAAERAKYRPPRPGGSDTVDTVEGRRQHGRGGETQ